MGVKKSGITLRPIRILLLPADGYQKASYPIFIFFLFIIGIQTTIIVDSSCDLTDSGLWCLGLITHCLRQCKSCGWDHDSCATIPKTDAVMRFGLKTSQTTPTATPPKQYRGILLAAQNHHHHHLDLDRLEIVASVQRELSR